MTESSYKQIIEEVYWLLGRADPTAEDRKGAIIQAMSLIEGQAPELAQEVCSKLNWPKPIPAQMFVP